MQFSIIITLFYRGWAARRSPPPSGIGRWEGGGLLPFPQSPLGLRFFWAAAGAQRKILGPRTDPEWILNRTRTDPEGFFLRKPFLSIWTEVAAGH